MLCDAESADGLCCSLTKACPKEPEPVPFKEFEVNRNDIEFADKLGAGQFGEVWKGKLIYPFHVIFMLW